MDEDLALTRLVALLGGINVGGRIVKNAKLQNAFTALGFRGVVTYKQTGNVVFETSIASLVEVRTKIERRLRRELGFDIPVFIRTIPQLKGMVERNTKAVGEGNSLLVTSLPGPIDGNALPLPLTIPKSTAEILSASGSEVFSLTHGGGEGALPNLFLESKLKVKATTRNMNVLREIVEKYG